MYLLTKLAEKYGNMRKSICYWHRCVASTETKATALTEVTCAGRSGRPYASLTNCLTQQLCLLLPSRSSASFSSTYSFNAGIYTHLTAN